MYEAMLSGIRNLSISFHVNSLLIFALLPIISVALSKLSSSPQVFKIVFNDKDSARISQDFVAVNTEGLFWSGNSTRVGVAPIHLAIETCADSYETLTNLFVYTRSDKEFKEVLQNITEQAFLLKLRTNASHFYCHIFIFIRSCNATISPLQLRDFARDSANVSTHENIIPFNWKSDLYLIQYCENNATSGVKIWEVYSVKNTIFTKFFNQQNTSQTSRDFTLVNLTEFSLAYLNNPKVIRRQNLEGLKITAAAFLNKDDENDNPYEIKLGKDKNDKEIFVSGLSVSIFNDFKIAMNFTDSILKIYFNLENYFETAFLSVDYQFDINMFHTGVTRNTIRIAQPLQPTFFDGVHAIFIQPSDRSVRNIYSKPFAFQMWSVLFYTWTCIFLSFKLTTYLHSKLEASYQEIPTINVKNPDEVYIKDDMDSDDDDPNNYHGTFETFLWCIGTICQQGWHTLPNSGSAKLIVTTGLFLSVVCYSAYTGKIVAELWDVPKPIKSLSQLLTYTDKVYLISAGDTNQDILEGLEKNSAHILKKVRSKPLETIYRKLLDHPGKACTITWPDTLFDYAKERIDQEHGGTFGGSDAYLCDTFHSFTFQPTTSLFVPKWSELEQLFNYRIILGLERGFIRRYWNTYGRQTKLFCLRNNPKVTTLGFTHVFFAFFVLWAGMAMAILFLLFEYIAFRINVKVPEI